MWCECARDCLYAAGPDAIIKLPAGVAHVELPSEAGELQGCGSQEGHMLKIPFALTATMPPPRQRSITRKTDLVVEFEEEVERSDQPTARLATRIPQRQSKASRSLLISSAGCWDTRRKPQSARSGYPSCSNRQFVPFVIDLSSLNCRWSR